MENFIFCAVILKQTSTFWKKFVKDFQHTIKLMLVINFGFYPLLSDGADGWGMNCPKVNS